MELVNLIGNNRNFEGSLKLVLMIKARNAISMGREIEGC